MAHLPSDTTYPIVESFSSSDFCEKRAAIFSTVSTALSAKFLSFSLGKISPPFTGSYTGTKKLVLRAVDEQREHIIRVKEYLLRVILVSAGVSYCE